MSPKAFTALLVLTTAAVALAGEAIWTRDVPIAGRVVDAPLLPGLADRLDQVAEIRIQGGGQVATIRRTDQGWGLVERDLYPVATAKVQELARGLTSLVLIEAKTADPERLARLELDDPGKDGTKSHAITLLDAKGQEIAAVVTGKKRYSLLGGGRSGTYVRKAGDDQAWLASGEVEIPATYQAWLTPAILDVPTSEVARVTLGADGPAPLVVAKEGRDAPLYTLSPLPEGRSADPEKLERVVGVLAGLSLQDVRRTEAHPLPADAPKARYETFDGLVVELQKVVEGEGDKAESWITVHAGSEPPLAPPPAEATGPSAADRASAIEAKTAGWSFKLPKWTADRLTTPLDELLAKPAGS